VQYKSLKRDSLLSYLDDYLQRGSEIMFAHRRGLRTSRWSYKELVVTARQTAQELHSRGIGGGNDETKQGDRVILCGHNSPEWAAAFWGCLIVGAVVVPLDRESTLEFASTVQQQTGAKLVIASCDAQAITRLKVPLIKLEDLRDQVSSHPVDPIASPNANDDRLAEIIFTSGTTSSPKGVMLTHANLLANLLPLEHEISKYLKWERFVHPIRFLNVVPLSHVFGQVMGLFVPQLLGGEVHFHAHLNPAEIAEQVRKNRISVVVLVPRVLESLQQWVERKESANGETNKLSSQITSAEHLNVARRWWKFRKAHQLFGWKLWAFVSGGATLEAQTEKFWQTLGFAVLQGYGMTETASLVSVTHPFHASRGSIGKLMPGYEVKLEQGGEIVVRGPSVSCGYWTAEGQASRKSDDWLRTGDIGSIDESGNLHFKGRAKEIIVTAAGLNVYPEDLENALNIQPEVHSSCVLQWHSRNGDEPMAVLILNDPRADVESVIERANRRLSDYQRIRHWRVWPSLSFPLTTTHKVLRREVAAKIEAELKLDDSHALKPKSSVVAEAARITGHEPAVPDEASLKLTTDLKLDSLGRIELLSALEDKYQIDIDEAAFTDATTVADVERIVRGEVDEGSRPYPYPTWSNRFPTTWIRVLLFYTIILPITLVMSRMRIFGVENLNNLNGPVLFIANHVTLGDHALILAALPTRMRHRLAIAMEGERLRDWHNSASRLGLLVRFRLFTQYVLVTTFFHVFPLPKNSGFRRSFAYAGDCVERGLSVLVFPEGLRAPRGQMHLSQFKAGIGLLAAELDIPVVPVKLRGLYELKRRQQYFASKGMVSVTFGEPLSVDRSLTAKKIAEQLQRRLELT